MPSSSCSGRLRLGHSLPPRRSSDLFRVRGLLPAEGHQAAPGHLQRGTTGPDERNRRFERAPDGVDRSRYRQPSSADSRRPPALDEGRSEEHTFELQSRGHLVCRLLPAPAASASATLFLPDALPISFGYGGYCLPKDTKQLLATYSGVPQALMSAIVASNERRMEWIAADIASRAPRTVGVHRLSMKAGSDNFRQSSILAVAQALLQRGITVEIFEPTLHQDSYAGMTVATDLEAFIDRCDLIITNRRSAELSRVEHKVYSRDVFGVN